MSKEVYSQFCADHKLPLFYQPWWLDLVCGSQNWDVAIVEKGGQIVGALPYYVTKRLGMTLLWMPAQTHTLGPWIMPSEAKYSKQLARQKDIMLSLISQLPRYSYFYQRFHYSMDNWLPFHWEGFEQTTKYTYVIENLNDLDNVWNDFSSNIRSDIRKAEKTVHLTTELSADAVYQILEKSFVRQGKKIPFSLEFFERLFTECEKRGCGKAFAAIDSDDQIHSVAYIVWDKYSSYYIAGGRDHEIRNTGSVSFCLWEAIKFSSKMTQIFDFEGSMIENVERLFRGFGARQIPYHEVSKCNSFVLAAYRFVKTLFEASKRKKCLK